MTGVVDGCEWSPLCVVGVRLMSGEWMHGGDLWTLIPLSSHSFHSSITLILFIFHSIHSRSLSFWHFLSLYPINTHSHSIQLSISPILYHSSLHVHSLCYWVGDGGGVFYSIHSLIHYSYSAITITSYCLSTTIWPHSLPILSISSHTYSFHITSFIYCSSLSLPLLLDYLSLISLAILFHSLFHSIILFHSYHFHTHHSHHHSTLSLLNTLVSIHLLSTAYTLHCHHISFIYYSIHSTTHSSIHHHSKHTLTIHLLLSSTIHIQFHSLFYTTHHCLYTSSFYSYNPIITIT